MVASGMVGNKSVSGAAFNKRVNKPALMIFLVTESKAIEESDDHVAARKT